MNHTAELPHEPPFKRRRIDVTDSVSQDCHRVESYLYCEASKTLPPPSPSSSTFGTPSSYVCQEEETEIYTRCENIVQSDAYISSRSLQRTCPNEDAGNGVAEQNAVGATGTPQTVGSQSCPTRYVSCGPRNERNKAHFHQNLSHRDPVLTADCIVIPKSSALE
jgi:hypothetical protein